jgi:hypothetical protein
MRRVFRACQLRGVSMFVLKKVRRKKFFFEKKNQKTFSAPLRAVLKEPGSKMNKVFLLLFVHKKKCFLSFPSLQAIRL